MKRFIGKKVLVRSVQAGVYFGILTSVEGEQVIMSNVRNIWSWSGASCLSQIANDGIKDGKVSPIVETMGITGVCQIIPLSEIAITNLEGQPVWKY